MARIYVGCSLTLAPPAFVAEVTELKTLLRAVGHEVAEFVGTVNGTALDVYQTDIHQCVANCDIFVAICDHPAIGLGWELGMAVEHLKKPVLAVAHTGSKVSRLPIGAADGDRNPLYRFLRYDLMAEVLPMVEDLLLEAEARRLSI